MQSIREFSSTAVDNLELDADTNTARVTFNNGSKYEYSNVDSKAIKALLDTSNEGKLLPSIGKWVNQFLVGNYETSYTQLA